MSSTLGLVARDDMTEAELEELRAKQRENSRLYRERKRGGKPPGKRGRPIASEHGTYARAKAHRRAGEEPCAECLEAERVYMREAQEASRRRKGIDPRPEAKPPPPPRELKPHGTWAAAQRHRRAKEPLCEPCKEAERTYLRERARAKAAKTTDG